MKIKNRFKTQKEAIAYLEARGWKFYQKSLGDLIFRRLIAGKFTTNRPDSYDGRIIVQYINNQWAVEQITLSSDQIR